MPQLQAVVIGASAGGLDALFDIVEGLPSTLPVAMLIVVHTRSDADSMLPQILGRRSRLPVVFAEDDAPIQAGRIYVAPPDVHLLVTERGIRLSRGPRENGFRPAIDPLFRSAARRYGPALMGVILSGALDDGTYGLKILKAAGGIAVVQDPDEAMVPSMPSNAMRFVAVDYVLPATDIADLIVRTAGTSVTGEHVMAPSKEPEPQNETDQTDVQEMQQEFGPPSGLTCPDCGGALWEIQDGKLARYRCHVGHQFTSEALDAEQQNAVEGALWSAVRVLEEHADLRRRMARRAEAGQMPAVSDAFAKSAHESQRQAHTIRELLFGRVLPSPVPVAELESAKAAKRSRQAKGSTNGKGRRVTRRSR
jgi:two-component system chemotaxis response regulator CheB